MEWPFSPGVDTTTTEGKEMTELKFPDKAIAIVVNDEFKADSQKLVEAFAAQITDFIKEHGVSQGYGCAGSMQRQLRQRAYRWFAWWRVSVSAHDRCAGARHQTENAMTHFATPAILSIVAQRNLCGMDGVNDVIAHMAGEDISGLQLSYVGYALPKAKDILIENYPELAKVSQESEEFVNDKNYEQWLYQWLSRYPATFDVPEGSITP